MYRLYMDEIGVDWIATKVGDNLSGADGWNGNRIDCNKIGGNLLGPDQWNWYWFNCGSGCSNLRAEVCDMLLHTKVSLSPVVFCVMCNIWGHPSLPVGPFTR